MTWPSSVVVLRLFAYVPTTKKRLRRGIATVLSAVIPTLGSAYLIHLDEIKHLCSCNLYTPASLLRCFTFAILTLVLRLACRQSWRKNFVLTFTCSVLLLFTCSTLLQAQTKAIFTPLGELPGDARGVGFYSEANSVSPNGLFVAGRSESHNGGEPMLWTQQNGLVGLGLLPSSYFAIANSVSNSGTAVGVAGFGCFFSSCRSEAFRYSPDDGIVGLGRLTDRHLQSSAYDVSEDGSTIVGWSGSSEDGIDGSASAFRWTATGGMTDVGDLDGGPVHSIAHAVSDDGAVVVGWSLSGEDQREAFIWHADAGMRPLGDLDGGRFRSEAFAVSSDGKFVVGSSRSLGDLEEAFIWSEKEGLRGLATPTGYLWTAALGVSDAVLAGSPVAVGWGYDLIGDDPAAFIWDQEHGSRDLKTVLLNEFSLSEALEGWRLLKASAITPDARVIVGYGISSRGVEAWRVEFVPEPSSAMLAAVGALIATAAGLRRRAPSETSPNSAINRDPFFTRTRR